MFKILQRYLGAQFILPFLGSSLFFILFLLTFQLFKITSLVVNKGVSLGVVFELIFYVAVTFIPIAIPISILFSTLFTLNRMSEDSEIIVMRSLGYPRIKIFAPFLISGILIAILMFILNSSVIPYSKKEFRKIITIVTSRGFLTDIKENSFYQQIPGVTIYSKEVFDEGKVLKDVFIKLIDDKKREEKVIFSKSGTLFKEIAPELGHVELRLKLQKGNIFISKQKEKVDEKIHFESYDFPIPFQNVNLSFVTKDSMKSSSDLKKYITSIEKKKKTDPKTIAKAKIEYWSRINNSFLCIAFLLVGFCLGIQNARGKRRNSSLLCFLVLVGYYALFFGGLSMAKNLVVLPWVAIFSPTLIAFLIGFYLYRKLEWTA